MKNRNKFIVSSRLANLQKVMCENLKLKSEKHVYEYARKVGMPKSECVTCECVTPTIISTKEDTCGVCNSNKVIQERY